MTIPSGAAAINPDLKFGVSNNISRLRTRTRQNVVQQLRDEKYPNSVPENWNGKKVKAGQVEGIDASKVTTGSFADARVPSVGELRDAIWQAIYGGTTTGHTANEVKLALMALVTRVTILENS